MRGGAMRALIGYGDADAGGAVVAEATVADVLRRGPLAAAAFAAAHEGALAGWLRMWLWKAAGGGEKGGVGGEVGAVSGGGGLLSGCAPPRRYRGPAVLEPGGGANEAANLALDSGDDDWRKDEFPVGREADGDAHEKLLCLYLTFT